ncbi:hypothetical protein [Sphingomonas sabuli]|nr:hypothetical protein [Sphingomonas sabuli]
MRNKVIGAIALIAVLAMVAYVGARDGAEHRGGTAEGRAAGQ